MKNPVCCLYALLGILLLTCPGLCTLAIALPANSPLTLDNSANVLHLGTHLQYAIATSDRADPAAAPTDDDTWQAGTAATLNLGYRADPVWIKVNFNTAHALESNWILEAANSQIDNIQVHLYRNSEHLKSWRSGDRLPFGQRPVLHRNFLFPLTLEPNQHYQLLIYVHNTEAMEVPLMLARQSQYANFDSARATIDGVFYGILLVIAAYSFMLYLILLDRTYLYYVAYVLSMLAFFLWQQGVLYQYLFPAKPQVQHLLAAHISLLIFASIALFFRGFLDLPRHVPLQWRIYKTLLAVHAVLCLTFWVLPYQTVIALMVVNTVASTLLAMYSITRLAMGGSRSAQIILAGWALLLFCLLFFTAAKIGVIYNDFMAQYGLRLGISFEILIFAFGLAFRIHQERDEKERALRLVDVERSERLQAQELALQAEKEARLVKEAALQAEKAHSEHLQSLVEARTADLENTLANLEQAHRELERLSALDGLTGIFNRRTFDEKLAELWSIAQRQGRPLSILMVDIDHFKHINDSLGHPCGDMVLITFSQMLRNIMHRPTDVLARYGGEEFAIILPDTPLSGAEVVAASIIRNAQQYLHHWEGEHFHVTASVGIACQVPQTNISVEHLLAQADQALYTAKREGRNRWVSHPACNNGGAAL